MQLIKYMTVYFTFYDNSTNLKQGQSTVLAKNEFPHTHSTVFHPHSQQYLPALPKHLSTPPGKMSGEHVPKSAAAYYQTINNEIDMLSNGVNWCRRQIL